MNNKIEMKMKKNQLTMLVLFVTMLGFTACSDDDKVTNSLSGTTWIADEEEERFTLIFAENTATFIYEFDANLDGVYDSSDEKETSIVNYSLNNNEITIIGGNSTAHGVITGNQLILSSDGDSITYYKK